MGITIYCSSNYTGHIFRLGISFSNLLGWKHYRNSLIHPKMDIFKPSRHS